MPERTNAADPLMMDVRTRAISDYLLTCRSASDFSPSAIAPSLLRHIYILDVRNGETGGSVRMQIRFAGTAIDHRFDRSVKGEFIDNYDKRGHSSRVLQGFERCALLKTPMWMRQVIVINSVFARYVEGVAHYLGPDRIYGALVTGDTYRLDNGPALKDSIELVELVDSGQRRPQSE